MMRALSTAGAGMVAQQYNLDTIANNLANVNTNAFKGQRAEFQDLMYQTFAAAGAPSGSTTRPTAVQLGLGTKFAATVQNLSQGTLQPTGRPFDMAIQGDGFFQVEKEDGSTAYTRDGSFEVDSSGQLVTVNGERISPAITVPSGAQQVSVSPSGIVSAVLSGANESTQIGQLTIAMFSNPAGLTRIGQNEYQASGGSGTPNIVNAGEQGAGTISQGFIEGSNVQIVEEMVKMIIAQRAYEINSKAVQTSDDMLGILNNLKR